MASNGQVTIRIVGDTSDAQKAIGEFEGKLGGFGGKVKTFAAGAAGGFAAAFAVDKVLAFGADLVGLGTKVEVWRQKTKTVFEGQAADVQKWADDNNEAFGITDDELAGLAASFGDLLKPMGFTSSAAADMSKTVVGLSGALSAWSGGQRSAAETSDILAKAILGERDGLKSLGISISEADVQYRLAQKGQEKLTGAALDQAKALATQELILMKSTDAQKAWTDGSMDNIKTQNELKATFAEVKEQLAAKLLPVFNSVAAWLVKDGIPAAERFGGAAVDMAGDILHLAGTLKKDAQEALREFVDSFLGMAEWITRGAAKAFGWVPDIGPQLRTAARDVEAFRDQVNAALGGIKFDGVNDGSVSGSWGEPIKKEAKVVGAAAGTGFVDEFAKVIPNKAEKVKAAVKKTAKDLAAEVRGQVSAMFSSFDAMNVRASAQRGVVAATESLNEALARQATLPVEIAKARRELTAAQADATQTTDEEALAVVQARKRMLEAEKKYKELAADTTTVAEDLTEAELEQRIARTAYTKAAKDALSPTEAVTAAQEKLKDLEAEQTEITKAVTEAQAALTQAKIDSVHAELAYLEAAKNSNEITKEAVALFSSLAEKAGLSKLEIDKLTGAFGNLKAGGGGAGVPNLGGAPTDFGSIQAPDDPFPQLKGMPGLSFREGAPFVGGQRVSFRDGVPYAGGRALLPSFGAGGVVPGPKGAPMMAVVHGGEEFSGVGRSLSDGVTLQVPTRRAGREVDGEALIAALKKIERRYGAVPIKVRG